MELNLTQKQVQTLSPQMMQSMEILQMGSQELLEYIEEAVQENPVLEPEETYDKQDKAITDMVREMGGMQTRYMSTANRILSENVRRRSLYK